MLRKDRNVFDPSKPALILTYGSSPGKIRPLDRECLVVGRAPACDLVLNSPEVSPVHCLLIKTSEGWLLRNTNPRVGTQVNGECVQYANLTDDDCIQIGTFSFKVHLPGESRPSGQLPVAKVASVVVDLGGRAAVDDARARRLRTSRQKVVRLAWNLRRRLMQLQSMQQVEKQSLADRNTDLEQRTHAVDARQRECDNLLRMLMDHEEEVSQQRQALLDAAAEFEAARRGAEEQLALRVAAAEAQINAVREQGVSGQNGEVQSTAGPADEATTVRALRELETRKSELDAYARYLRAQRSTAVPTGDNHAELQAQVRKLQAELDAARLRQQSSQEESQRADSSRQELNERRAELDGLRAQNAELSARLLALQDEVQSMGETSRHSDELRAQIARLENEFGSLVALQSRAETLAQERDILHGQLQAVDADRERLRVQSSALHAELVKAREEYDSARLRLIEQERDLQDKAHLLKESKVLSEESKYLRDKLQTARDELLRLHEQQAVWEVQAERLAEADALRTENEQLHQQVIELGNLLREKERLQRRFDEQGQELIALRDRLRNKDEELRSFRAADAAPQPLVNADEHAELVIAVETLLRENEEFRVRLLDQARSLKEAYKWEELCTALQAEVAELRAPRQTKSVSTDYAIHIPSDGADETNLAIKPNQYLHKENEDLKARLTAHERAEELARAERVQLTQKIGALQSEVDRLQSEIDGFSGVSLLTSGEAEAGWNELVGTGAGSTSLLGENDALRDQLAEKERQLAEAARVQQEYETLRGELSRQRELPAAPQAANAPDHLEAESARHGLAGRIEELERQIPERDAHIANLQAEIANLKLQSDYDTRMAREAELQNEREMLLAQRAALEHELIDLRNDRKELDAAAHQAELTIAKERKQITNEWAELNRKREEFRMEVEKEKRDHVRESLDRVRRIKEESQVKREGSLSTLVAQRIGERRLLGPSKGQQ